MVESESEKNTILNKCQQDQPSPFENISEEENIDEVINEKVIVEDQKKKHNDLTGTRCSKTWSTIGNDNWVLIGLEWRHGEVSDHWAR